MVLPNEELNNPPSSLEEDRVKMQVPSVLHSEVNYFVFILVIVAG